MNKLKAKAPLLMLPLNLTFSLVIAAGANLITIGSYYQLGFFRSLQRLLFNNFFTLAYMLLLWLLNYVVIETLLEILDNLIPARYRYLRIGGNDIISSGIALLVGLLIALLVWHPVDLYYYNFIGVLIYVIVVRGSKQLQDKGGIKIG